MKKLSIDLINNNKLKFMSLVNELNTKEPTDLAPLMSYLESQRVDYFNKPYNNYPEYSYAGSLCEHSLKLYDELKKLCELYYPGQYSNDQIIKVALFKDLYRAELYELYTKNVKNDVTGQWEALPAYRTKEIRPIFGDISFSSYMIAKKFINLIDDEVVEAIIYSNNSTVIDLHNIRKSYPLVVLTNMAELAVMYIGE